MKVCPEAGPEGTHIHPVSWINRQDRDRGDTSLTPLHHITIDIYIYTLLYINLYMCVYT